MTEAPKTLRDEFAMAVLPAVMETTHHVFRGSNVDVPATVAKIVYGIADALMAERAASSLTLTEGDR